MKLWPHRTARSIEWTDPIVLIEDQVGRIWDYAAEITVFCRMNLDLDQVLAETGLTSSESLSLVLQVDCPATSLRKVDVRRLESEHVECVVSIPPGEVAKELVISRFLCLDSPVAARPGVARNVGDLLAEAPRQVHVLENQKPLFPVEAVRFEAHGLPADALWNLDFTPTSLDDLHAGVTRLKINVDHPVADALLDPDHAEHVRLTSVLRVDVMFQMLVLAATRFDQSQFEQPEWETGSVGDVLTNLAGTYVGLPLSDASGLIRMAPMDVATRLQNAAGYLRAGTA